MIYNAKRKYYVYFLRSSKDNEIFYIGKGIGKRAYTHKKAAIKHCSQNPRKTLKIQEILQSGYDVVVDIFADKLLEHQAFDIEREQIKKYKESITNHSSGIKSYLEKAKLMHSKLKPLNILMNEMICWSEKERENRLFYYRALKNNLKEIIENG